MASDLLQPALQGAFTGALILTMTVEDVHLILAVIVDLEGRLLTARPATWVDALHAPRLGLVASPQQVLVRPLKACKEPTLALDVPRVNVVH